MKQDNLSSVGNKRATISDIAAEVGITPSAVAMALKGVGRISEKTIERVRESAARLDYQPSLVARSLVTQRTSTIGVIVPVLEDTNCSQMVAGIQSVSMRRDYSPVIYSTEHSPDRIQQCFRTLHGRHVEGILTTVPQTGQSEDKSTVEWLCELGNRGTPLVILEQLAEPRLTTVGTDEIGGAMIATEHLISLGHKRIGYAQMKGITHNRHLLGYKAALEKAGLEYDESLVAGIYVDEDPQSKSPVVDGLAQFYREHRPTAVFVGCDMFAMKILRACHLLGIRVPEDLAVVGHGNILASEHTLPSMTTVHVDSFAQGRRAAELLFDRIDGKLQHHVNECISSRLIVRESCGAPISSSTEEFLALG